ncbi:Actin-like protein ARP6 [Leucoagaricus sp. SymC.cos]|nr:Actin-like protein ARP6 [Leucoagaricus sp. SymC.cos]
MLSVVIDNGAHTIKAGIQKGLPRFIGSVTNRIIPNAVIRSKGDKATYFGHEFERCSDYSSLHYRLPFEKGYIVDWDAQKAIWDGLFSTEVFNVDTTQASLLLTEPYFNLPNIQDVYDQFVFEEYEFQSYYRCTPASLIPYGTLFKKPREPKPECCIIVDSGFSFTHVIPVMENKVIWNAVKRVDVGGKLLTNHLKELVSYRQWNMMDETFIVNDVKEKCCFVSQDFRRDLETCAIDPTINSIVQDYILPDLSKNQKGHVRSPDDILLDTDQVLVMNNERFTVPELLFRPDDIGLEQMGLASTIAHVISLLPEDLQGMFWANIGLIGGSINFSGFRARLLQELQPLAPMDSEIVIYESVDPVLEPYRSALHFNFTRYAVTRAEYQEMGSEASRRKFKSINKLPVGASADDGVAESDNSSEPGQKAVSSTTSRGKKTTDERGTTGSTKATTITKGTKTGSTRQSAREGTSRRK